MISVELTGNLWRLLESRKESSQLTSTETHDNGNSIIFQTPPRNPNERKSPNAKMAPNDTPQVDSPLVVKNNNLPADKENDGFDDDDNDDFFRYF